MKNINEVNRIREVYEKRKIKKKDHLYSYFNTDYLFVIQRREYGILKAFKWITLSFTESFLLRLLSVISP